MSRVFDPLNHPVCLSVPRFTTAPSSAVQHVPFAMLLVDLLRPAVIASSGRHGELAHEAFEHASRELGLNGTRCVLLHGGLQGDGAPFISALGQEAGTDAAAMDEFEVHSVGLLWLDAEEPSFQSGAWERLLSDGGVALIYGSRGDGARAVRELAASRPSFEFDHGGGLCVLTGSGAVPPSLEELFNPERGDRQKLKEVFRHLGSRLEIFVRRDPAALKSSVAPLMQKQSDANGEAMGLSELSAFVESQRKQLHDIHGSLGFRVVRRYWALRESVLPPGTRRGQLYQQAKQALEKSLGADPRAVLRRAIGLDAAHPTTKPAPKRKYPWSAPLSRLSRASFGEQVLIIAELSLPQCKRYRVDQKAEMFTQLGYDVTVLPWNDHEACRSALQTHALVIFYRVPAFEPVVELITEARRLGLTSFFDLDDLIFDEQEYAKNGNVQKLSEAERKTLMDGVALYRRALTLCDHVIGSTPTITARMKALSSGEAFMVENCLDQPALEISAEQQRRPVAKAPGVVTIGYGSGTRTHDADFAIAADALLEVMEQFPHVRLALHGYLELPKSFERVKDRVFRIPFLHAQDYLRAVGGWDISIAPLEQSVFNDAKSNIKYLEASVMRVPTVCSPAAAFRQVVQHDVNGLIASDKEEWRNALTRLVEDKALRTSLAEEAHRTVMARYHPRHIARTQLAPILGHMPRERRANRLNVLEVNLLFAPQSFGGATVVAEQLSERLRDLGCDVTVFTGLLGDGLPAYGLARYEVNGLPVIGCQVPPQETRALDYQNGKMGEVFRSVLRAVRPDVVHLHSIQMLSASLAEACAAEGIPYVITVHDAWWLCEKQFMVKEDGNYCFQQTVSLTTCSTCVSDPAFTHRRTFALRGVLDGAALLLAPSEFQRQLYLANGIPEAKIAVNKNGILPPRHVPPPRPARTRLRFAYLGGKAAHKGYYWLKEIFEGIPSDNYELRLVDIHSRLGSRGIDASDWKVRGDIKVVPAYSQDGLDDFFAEVDVLLLPSRWKESFGLTVREALARNCWVITTDSGGVVEDVVRGSNGDIVAIGDTVAFRRAITALLENPQRLAGYRNPARELVRGFDEQTRELHSLLSTLVQRAQSTNVVKPSFTPGKSVGAIERRSSSARR
ncbi:MAG: glycosyltransferase [Myxococcaceae bacterium]